MPLSDPTSERLKLIEAHPTLAEATVTELLIFYIEAVEENPFRENGLASALAALHDSLGARIIQDGSSLAQAFDDGLNLMGLTLILERTTKASVPLTPT